MSQSKKDQVFHAKNGSKNEQYVAIAISKALRKEYGKLGSAIKRISRRIGANPRAIRNWYEARNAPSSSHLLLLAQASPAVFEALLELLGRSDLLEYERRDSSSQDISENSPNILTLHGEENFTINLKIRSSIRQKLNQRQLWFLSLVQQEQNIRAAQIASTWKVSLRTARADISYLIKKKLVVFRGSKARGRYKIVAQ